MKRVMLLAGLFCGVLSVLTAETAVTIDTALANAADYLTGVIPEGSKIAVLNIKVEQAGNTDGSTAQPKNWIYLGARVGLAQGIYGSAGDLFPASTPLTGKLSFDAALYMAVNILYFFEIQTEALVRGNRFDIERNSTFKSVAYTSLEIPLLARLVWRPSIFMVQGYGGAAVSVPLGQGYHKPQCKHRRQQPGDKPAEQGIILIGL